MTVTDHFTTIAAHVTLLLTTIAGFLFQWLREARKHRWNQEKFEALRKQIQNGSK